MSSVSRSADDETATVNVKMLQQMASYMDGWTDRMCKRVDELLQIHSQSAASAEVIDPGQERPITIALTA